MKKKFAKRFLIGSLIGVVNGFFGAGGGLLAVPFLKSEGLNQQSAHENAVAVILPITVFSAVLYMYKGFVSISDALVFVPTGLIGAFIGTKIIAKISPKLLKGVFGFFMIYAGIRLLKG